MRLSEKQKEASPTQEKPKDSPKSEPTPRLANGQKFLKDSTLNKIPKLYETDGVPMAEKTIYAKFFHPRSDMTWFAAEYDPKTKEFFGFAGGAGRMEDAEWGYFRLKDLQDNDVERDQSWDESTNFKDAIKNWRKESGYGNDR